MTPEERASIARRIHHAKVADEGAAKSSKPNPTGGEDDYRLAVELGRRFGATDKELTELGVPKRYLKKGA